MDQPEQLDWRAIFQAVWQPVLYWAVAVSLVSWLNAPGVGCLTPGGWLMGVSTGRRVGQYSHSQDPKTRNKEAALSGLLLGLALSVVFILWSLFPMGGLDAWDDQAARANYFLLNGVAVFACLAVPMMLSVSTLNAKIPRRP